MSIFLFVKDFLEEISEFQHKYFYFKNEVSVYPLNWKKHRISLLATVFPISGLIRDMKPITAVRLEAWIATPFAALCKT